MPKKDEEVVLPPQETKADTKAKQHEKPEVQKHIESLTNETPTGYKPHTEAE